MAEFARTAFFPVSGWLTAHLSELAIEIGRQKNLLTRLLEPTPLQLDKEKNYEIQNIDVHYRNNLIRHAGTADSTGGATCSLQSLRPGHIRVPLYWRAGKLSGGQT